MENDDDDYINFDLIINKEALKDINVICEICKGLLKDPVQCSVCEHTFCKSCIEKFQEKEKEKKCLFNCENALFNQPIIINNSLKELKFKCKNNCDVQIPY